MKRLLWVVVLLPCIAFAQNAPAFQEKSVIAAIDRFIGSQRENYYAYENMLEEVADAPDSVRFQQYRNDAFVIALRKFFGDHAGEYMQLRRVRFAMYAPPPQGLLRIKWDSAGVRKDVAEMDGNFDLLTPAFFRVFDPHVLSQIVSGFMLMSAYDENPSARKSHLAARAWYGTRIYTKRITPAVWQVWAADRMMAFTFKFDLATGIVQPIARTRPGDPAYGKITWAPTPVHFREEADHILADAFTEIWNSYRPGASIESRADLEKKQTMLRNFRTANAQRYRAAILQQLDRLEAPPAMPAAFRERTKPGDALLQYADSVVNAAINVFPAQWASAIDAAAFPFFELNRGLLKVVVRNSYFPTHQYARKINALEWEVMVVQEMSATVFTWNTGSGMVGNIRYWMKEG
ncbi:hypothetical protein ACQKLP_26350 [Chitinophaga sp. NPDC101104]|uniref:hypothetical protein n=1 Tax=Chitinophaga sp. NPDC101104 TaxID=3390561 RepID=UPI003CFE30AC